MPRQLKAERCRVWIPNACIPAGRASDVAQCLLASVQSLKMRSVMLYEETRVREIASLQNLVVGKLGQLSTGISSIGSPGWVLGALSVLVFENSASFYAVTTNP